MPPEHSASSAVFGEPLMLSTASSASSTASA